MMDQEELDIELIENYFSKTLSSTEMQHFTERIKSSHDFAQKVDDYKEIIEVIKRNAQEDFKNEVAGWEADIKNEESKTKPLFWKPYLSIAAAILLLIIASVYFFSQTNKPKTAQQLFTAYFTPYEDAISVRGNNSLEKKSLEQAMVLYNEEKYQQAISYFKTYLILNKNDINALFYLTISQLALHNTGAAIPALQYIIKQNATLHDQAEWYLCLAYLADNNTAAAFNYLKKITNDPIHIFQKQANELMHEIE